MAGESIDPESEHGPDGVSGSIRDYTRRFGMTPINPSLDRKPFVQPPDEASGFVMNTDVVPEDVDIDLAARRNALIEAWREGVVDAQKTMRDLMALYWNTQRTADGPTRNYLMAASYQFPVEAGIPDEIASQIYLDSQKNH